jgi:sugar/nucleoside kinase (ribokinase family)
MRGYDLLVVGELNADVIVRGGDVVPAFGQAEQIVSADLELGSSGAITACGAAKLGLAVGYAGLVGDDALGDFVLEQLSGQGVDVRHVVRRPGGRTGVTVVLAGDDGDRALLTFPGLIAELDAREVTEADARHVHVSSYFLQHRLRPGLPALLAAFRARDASTSLDPNWDPSGEWEHGFAALLPALDVVFPNEQELRRLTGLDDLEAGAAALAAAGPTVAVKLGAAGALAHDGAQAVRMAAPAVATVETTGAGDSFDAGYLAALLAGRDLAGCLALANACGALSTRAAGGTPGQPDAEEAWRVAGELLATTVVR